LSLHAKFRIDCGSAGPSRLDVDLHLPTRGVTALFGPSGCGKTTLLRAIAGLDRHAQGELQFEKTTWQDADHFLAPHHRDLGYVFQEASLFPHLDVRRNLEYGYRRTPKEQRTISLDHAISLLGLEELLQRRPTTLSGGERQRVAIARALAVSPRLLLMDEPLAALDAESRQAILPYLEDLHRELAIPVLYVSHTLDEIARLADHLVLMDNGKVVATGPVMDLLTRLDLPLAVSPDAAAIVETSGAGFDEKFHLTHLEFQGGGLVIPGKVLAQGATARVKLAARDVSLTLDHQESTSIQNIFPADVEEVQEVGAAQVVVRLQVGGTRILSRITQKSASELGLRPGKAVYAQVKSVGLLA
jgi:molybdate transport system ATP-binding protein